MRVRTRILGMGLVIALFFMVYASPSAHAEGAPMDGIALTPTTKHHNVKPGGRVSDSFTIINTGTSAYDFILYAKPYTVKNAGYTPVFSEEGEFADAYKWVSFPKTTYRLEAGQRVSVPYELIVSPGARSGGHYGAIFAESQAIPLEGQVGVTNNKSVGMLLYVNVEGSSVTQGALKKFSTSFYQPQAPLSGAATVGNTGETDFMVSATFAVMDVAGDVKYQTSGDYAVLPMTERAITFTWDKSPWFGLYKVRASVSLLGKTEVNESFVVIAPRWLPFIAGLAILLGAVDVVRRKRTTTKRQSH